jgi:hypothetical protein
MSEVQVFFQKLQQTIQQQNGLFLSKLLCLPLETISPQLRSLTRQLQGTDTMMLCNSFFGYDKLASVIGFELLAIICIVEGNYEQGLYLFVIFISCSFMICFFFSAYRNHQASYNALLDLFGNKDYPCLWMVPMVIRSSNDLKECASLADQAAKDLNYKLLRESISALLKAFNLVTKEKTSVNQQGGSKKLAIFGITNVLFKIYFKVNTLQLCGNLIRVIEMKGPGSIMENLHLFPVCDVVMYKYYIGRLKMFEDRYEESRECLRFALSHTPKNQLNNRRRILISLIPVEVFFENFDF